MKKRLAIFAVSAITALTAIGGTSAAIKRDFGPSHNAPAASCGMGDTACRLDSTSQQGPLVSQPMTQTSSASHGAGYHIG
jgi:hypothetical protein